jgi:heme exporter protein D
MDANFWHMSGYAAYVWGSFGVAALVFVWAALAPRRRRRELLDSIRGSAEDV